MRDTLVAALALYADSPKRFQTRRFLAGLSFDELQFIADFMGACILDSAQRSRDQMLERLGRFQATRRDGRNRSEDRDRKMILLVEYLRQSVSAPLKVARAGHA